MATNFALTPAQVNKTVATIIKHNPVYADMLGFYGRLFVAQEESNSRLRIEPLQIPNDELALKRREKFPLVEIKAFAYDPVESANLFVTIGKFAKEANPKLAALATAILDAFETNLNPEILFKALLNSNEAVFENVAEELEIGKKVLGLIAYNSLKPSLCACAEQLSAYLSSDEPWLKGYCPICGSAPILSILEGEGARSLFCSFCWHQWPVKRVYCPFCGNADNKDLHYLFSEEEQSLRVDLCDKCNKYLKTLDTRKADRLIYPPLEQVSTLHLDFKAQEEGFEAGVRLYMEM